MAKKKDYKKLNDTAIVAKIDDCVQRSVGYNDSELSTERANVLDYYNGTKPKPAHDGNSKYVSLDVYDAVESLKAALLETFSAGARTVKFAPENEEDVQMAKVCSEYTDYVANRQNNMYEVMSTAIHDGLIARVGIVKAYWQISEAQDIEGFAGLSEDELDLVLAQEGVELLESEESELGLMSGAIGVTRDTSQVVIENIAPEEFLIESQAKDLDSVNFCAHRTRMTLSELREEGYDEKLISKIGEHNDVELETDPEVLARFDSLGGARGVGNNDYQDQVRNVMVYEAYIKLDVEGTGVAELYKCIKAGNVLLEKEKVQRKPFFAFVPLPVPHSFLGNNYAEKVIPTQNARTVLTRSILDHAMITNNPRYMVLKGGLTNPRELLDNRVGGVVNVTRPDAVSPMAQSSLNPFIFQTIQMLDEDKEDTTGVSKMSQGLNKDAISKQNSAAMVEQLATMSQQRQKIIARNFANSFLKPLYHEIYCLCVENEDNDKIVDLSGEYVTVSPSSWKDQRDVVIELALGYGEQEKESQKLMAMHQLFTSDPNLSKMYQEPNQFALISQIMEISGVKNVNDYLTNPENMPEQQGPTMEQQMAQMEMQMAQKQLEINDRQTAVAELKAQTDAEIAKMKLELEKLRIENQHAIASDKVDISEEQLKHKKLIDAAELILAQNATDITAIASPNG